MKITASKNLAKRAKGKLKRGGCLLLFASPFSFILGDRRALLQEGARKEGGAGSRTGVKGLTLIRKAKFLQWILEEER